MSQKLVDPVALTRARIPHVEEYYDLLAYEMDPLGGYRLCRSQQLPHVTINSGGYRGRLWNGQETVLLLGDSVTFGAGASGDDACFARFLESSLSEQVADASVRAYRVFQHYLQLPRLLHRLPKLRQVVLWGGYADLSYWVTTGGCVEGAYQFEWKYQGSRRHPLGVARWRRRLKLPRMAELIHNWLTGPTRPNPRDRGSLEALAEHTAGYVRAIRDVCAARGIEMTLVLQPFVRSQPTDPALRELCDACDDKTREKCGRSWYELAPSFIELLQRALGTPAPVRWVDPQRWVHEEDFFDQAHLREEALRRIAERLMQDQWFLRSQTISAEPQREMVS